MRTEGSEKYPTKEAVTAAEWTVSVAEGDVYEHSITGSLSVEGDAGELVVRVRFRKDAERLPEDVVREERGFWTGEKEPGRGDVPLDTEVSTWKTEASGDADLLSVCETVLSSDAAEVYEERMLG